MRRSKIMVTTTALALSLALGACGGGEEEPTEAPSESASESAATPSPTESESQAAASSEYCQQLEASRGQFDSLAQGDARQLDEAVAELRELQETAPSDIRPAWNELLAPIDQLETGLNEAGLELSDLDGVSRGEFPQGVDPQRLRELAAEMQGLSSAEVNQAADEIKQYASDECGITLGQ